MSNPTFTTPPTAPNTNAPTVFASRMDTFLGWFQTQYGELVTFVTWTAAQVTTIVANAAAALSSQNAAAASAASAATAASATLWNALTNYAIGARAISAINFQVYTAKTGGVHATDPSADATNWVAVNSLGISSTTKTSGYTAVAGDQYPQDTSGGAFTVNLPASPNVGDAAIRIQDYAGTFGTSNLILDPGGNNYRGVAQTITCDITNFSGLLAWAGSSRGWDWI